MNTSRKIGSVALALSVVLGLTSGPALASGGKGRNWVDPEALVGPWRVTISPYRCDDANKNPLGSIQSTLTFAKGGTLLETGSNNSFQPGQRSVGHGYWVRTGKKTYHSVFEAYIYFSTETPPPFYKKGTQRFQQDIKMLDRDSWESDADVYFYDTEGKLDERPGSPGCATVKAERLW